jgi:BirA family biotin operon repressor/biotin-[acetyl-CoA-carboxylase] ligase
MVKKDQLLYYLKQQKGSWVSGELLSREMAISRAAIWKHIRGLKQDGYVIESSPKKGYLLREAPDFLLPEEIRDGLCAINFGRKEIFYFKEIDSTNEKAKSLAAEGAPEGTLVVAESQTKGRGRRGRGWFSPFGEGIYISLILRPSIAPNEAPKITLMTAVVVAEALLAMIPSLSVRIKWPNDILVNGKKMAGILTEISTEMDLVEFIVIGLGVNVNMNIDRFPKEIRGQATSILISTGSHFSRSAIVKAYLQYFEKYYGIFKKNGFETVMRRWRGLSDIIGQKVMVDVMGEKHVGDVMNVDNNGILILKDDRGRIQRIFSGDVILV